MGDGFTVPGTDNLPDGKEAEDGIINLILAHPQIVAAVILAAVLAWLVRKHKAGMMAVGAGLLVYVFMKMSGKA